MDQTQGLDYGLIAEEVAKIDPNLAIRDGRGHIENVRYNAINAMLLNEFLKEHRKVEAQQTRIEKQAVAIDELNSIVAQQRKGFESELAEERHRIEVLTAGLSKVSASLRPGISAAMLVADDQPGSKRRDGEH